MNTCSFQPRLSAYYDGELGDGELGDADRAALRDHLAECSACAAELAAFGKLSLALSEQKSANLPADAMIRLRSKVRHSAQQRLWREAGAQFDRTVRRVTGVAAVILVGASAAFLLLPARSSDSALANEVMTESLASSTDAISQTVYSPGGDERQLARWIVADLSQRDAMKAAH